MEEEEKNLIYIDNNNIKWNIGSCNIDNIIKIDNIPTNTTIIWLPILIQSMNPEIKTDPMVDYIYCTCIQCNSFIENGIVCIEFTNELPLNWGIRLLCVDCFPETFDEIVFDCQTKLVVEIPNMLAPKLVNACETYSKKCIVCDKPYCDSGECLDAKLLLYNNDIDIILDHFYKINVEILSPFREDNVCDFCNDIKGIKYCNICKLRIYCSSKCKKNDKKHLCKSYCNVWRNKL
jgi:hypothetical protein